MAAQGEFMKNTKLLVLLVICSIVFSSIAFAQEPITTIADGGEQNKLVPPKHFNVQKSCVDLNADNDQFPNVFSNASLKRSGVLPTSTIFTPFADNNTLANGSWDHEGPSVDFQSILYVQGSHVHQAPVVNGLGFSLITQQGVQKKITAAILKFVGGSTVFAYNAPGVLADATLETFDQRQIIETEFCYNPSGTTAADVTISGRVTNGKGGGISRARVTAMNATTGEISVVQTSIFGYYEIPNLDMDMYFITVTHKAWDFGEGRTMTLDNALEDFNWIGRPKR